MGKQRFRFSHMIPNAWFYRLRDMNPNKKPLTTHAYNKSFSYTPRVDSNTDQLTHTHDQDLFLSPTTSSSYYESTPSTTCSCGGVISNSSTTDAVIKFNEKSYTKRIQDSSGYHELIQLQKPPPILTKSKLTMVEKKEETSSQSCVSFQTVKESISKEDNPVSGVKIRSNSSGTPLCNKIVGDHKRQKNMSSCCIVKSSFDPHKDFKESMMAMIVEDKIWASKDLENLLASYLSLNSNQYHDMIIKAFEEIWLTFDHFDR